MIVDNFFGCRFAGSMVISSVTLVIRKQLPELERTDYLPVAAQIFLQTCFNLSYYTAVTIIPIGTAACCAR